MALLGFESCRALQAGDPLCIAKNMGGCRPGPGGKHGEPEQKDLCHWYMKDNSDLGMRRGRKLANIGWIEDPVHSDVPAAAVWQRLRAIAVCLAK